MAKESDNNSDPDRKPAVLPPMTYNEVKARAQRILDRLGRPPYEMGIVFHEKAAQDEADVVSEFVTYWMPFLTEKEKKG